MTTITLELPADLYQRLQDAAAQRGISPPTLAQDWLMERLLKTPAPPASERDDLGQALTAAGLIADPTDRAAAPINLDALLAAMVETDEQSLRALKALLTEHEEPQA